MKARQDKTKSKMDKRDKYKRRLRTRQDKTKHKIRQRRGQDKDKDRREP